MEAVVVAVVSAEAVVAPVVAVAAHAAVVEVVVAEVVLMTVTAVGVNGTHLNNPLLVKTLTILINNREGPTHLRLRQRQLKHIQLHLHLNQLLSRLLLLP